MTTTTNIPQVTLPVGSRTFGPASAVNAEASITLTIDRTVGSGLNSLASSSVLSVDVQQSDDGGTTWADLGAWTTTGGVFTIKGVQVNQSSGTWNLASGTSRQVRAIVTVSGPSSIAVAGTIVTQ